MKLNAKTKRAAKMNDGWTKYQKFSFVGSSAILFSFRLSAFSARIVKISSNYAENCRVAQNPGGNIERSGESFVENFLGLDNFSSCDRMDDSFNSDTDGLTDSFRSSSGENIPAGDHDSGSPSILDLATATLGSSSGINAIPNPSSFP